MSFTLGGAAAAANPDDYPVGDVEWKRYANGGTVRIITKGLGCTCTAIASDMARVLNDMGDLRVLPVIGHGSLQGIADVMYLKGIDLSILQSDVLAYVKRNRIHPNIDNKVRYVTKLYNSELHLIAGRGIEKIQDLNGKPVSFDVKGRGAAFTAQNVFDAMGIVPVRLNLERDVAIQKIRTGEIAAAFVVTGKPADSMLNVEPGDGLHFLNVPFLPALAETYLPSKLTHEDYPNLVAEGQAVDTIAVGEVLAVYNWAPESERYKKLERFVAEFFSNFAKFQDPVRHPKWRDVNLAASLPGWKRFKPAQDWLDKNTPASAPPLANLRSSFERFLAESNYIRPSSPQDQDALFQAFLNWAKNQQ
ncbi:MAG: TAXI family TRAP transporter solute-binding subunit [Kiloniellales bacterium]|nr:TAXI family TRAP transporter solute-binding subunit [Kiloniellales bacterium]